MTGQQRKMRPWSDTRVFLQLRVSDRICGCKMTLLRCMIAVSLRFLRHYTRRVGVNDGKRGRVGINDGKLGRAWGLWVVSVLSSGTNELLAHVRCIAAPQVYMQLIYKQSWVHARKILGARQKKLGCTSEKASKKSWVHVRKSKRVILVHQHLSALSHITR